MTKKTEKIYREFQNFINDKTLSLSKEEYYDFLEELSDFIKSLIECYKDENPEDFE